MCAFEIKSRYQLIAPNLPFAKYDASGGIKRFTLVAEEVRQAIVGTVNVKAWGYNGTTPGPLMVVHEYDHVQVVLRNHLPEPTSIHWHGLVVPNEVDGLPLMGNGPLVQPGEEYTYEFIVRQTGTYMYHAHVHSAMQERRGLGGMFIALHLEEANVDRDYVFLLQDWNLRPSGHLGLMKEQLDWAEKNGVQRWYEVNPKRLDSNYFTINGKAFPDTDPLQVRRGERVRIRIGNLGVEAHPMHLHGHTFQLTAADGARITRPMLKNTVNVAPGETWDLEFYANNPGVWAFHCQKPHHITNAMESSGGMLTTVRYLDPLATEEE